MAEQKESPGLPAGAQENSHSTFCRNDWPEASEGSRARQSDVVLIQLREGPKTTLELRALGIGTVAARIYSLKKAGHIILTTRKGAWACYALVSGGAA